MSTSKARLRHIAISVENVAAAQKFFEDAFGMTKAGDAGTATPLPVQIGLATGERIQVLGEVQPGQMVVVEGNERLRPAQPVVVSRVRQPEPPSDVPNS